jgi:uncharacterized protein YukJ
LAIAYGVLRGKVDRWQREDHGASPHLQIRLLDGQGVPWRIPVNVRSGDLANSLVIYHRVDPLRGHPILAALPHFAIGLTDLQHMPRTAANALDYLRAPLFDWTSGRALPPTGPLKDDDLQDVVSHHLGELRGKGGELYVFGSHWQDPRPKPGMDTVFGTRGGMHDIHLNQGNPLGSFGDDNGVFQDGGLILKFPDRYLGMFFRFKRQWLPTDARGSRIPGVSQEIPIGAVPTAGEQPGAGEVHPAFPAVYIVRALVNPVGEDPTHEVVVIGNTTMRAIDLTGWKIVDKDGAAETLRNMLLPPGGSTQVTLSGTGARLSNQGGTIRLLNQAGEQVHAVSYARDDVVVGRFLRFKH